MSDSMGLTLLSKATLRGGNVMVKLLLRPTQVGTAEDTYIKIKSECIP